MAAEAELAATVDHTYPAPLQRLWRSHFAQMEHPPDVIASLADQFYSGGKSFGTWVNVASTRGSLNRRNSLAFIMSTAAAMPGVMRSQDIPRHMAAEVGEPWPLPRDK